MISLDKPDPGPFPVSAPHQVFVSDDPDRSWHELGPSLISDLVSYNRFYAAIGVQMPPSSPYWLSNDLVALRASAHHQILTPDECIKLAKSLGPQDWMCFRPLVGGLNPELSWRSLHLFEKQVLPAIADELVVPSTRRAGAPMNMASPDVVPAGAVGMTASDQLARHARKIPDEKAITLGTVVRTYRELDERVSRLANALRARNVSVGDRVAVLSSNCLEIVETYLASVRLGAICVPINFRLVAEEIAYLLNDSNSRAIVVDAARRPILDVAEDNLTHRLVRLVIADDTVDGSEHYESALTQASARFDAVAVDEGAPAFIMYTSGTTGRPKGAVLTHRNLVVHAFSVLLHLGTPHDDAVTFSGVPLFHISGVSGYLICLMVGGNYVIARSGGFDPRESLDALESHRVTSCFFVPSQWQAICDVPDLAERDLTALRRIKWGAAPATTSLLSKLNHAFPKAQVVAAFGQTECSPVTCYLQGDEATQKIGSVGKPILNVEVRIVDEDMNDVAAGAVGEIVYRGPTVMKEYWNRPDETAEAFTGGWFHSGDLVRRDSEGFIYVVDRKKDMIISGGENIYCAEIEDVLAAHPKVAEVALIGVPHTKWGEAPLAVIVPTASNDPPTAEELVDLAREHLAGYKCPRRIWIVDALPRNSSGKVLKTQLRAAHGLNSSLQLDHIASQQVIERQGCR